VYLKQKKKYVQESENKEKFQENQKSIQKCQEKAGGGGVCFFGRFGAVFCGNVLWQN
jgi:hypothetical protein